jgi:hypothetical protein
MHKTRNGSQSRGLMNERTTVAELPRDADIEAEEPRREMTGAQPAKVTIFA